MKYYVRCGKLPDEQVSASECLNNNIIGSNCGNLLYQYSVMKTIETTGTKLISNRYNRSSFEDVDLVNNECDAVILPLADAFRNDFINELNYFTSFISKVKVPCIVSGVGVKAEYNPDFSKGKKYDEFVKRFVKAVLNTGTILGLRGELTGAYLKSLGFREEIDYTVIGCPSFYLNGRSPKINRKIVDENSMIGVSADYLMDDVTADYTELVIEKYKNSYLIGQCTKDLKLLYTGVSYNDAHGYPCLNTDCRLFRENRVKFFTDVPTWIDFLKKADCVVGSRLHGTVAGLMAGTPSLLVCNDARKQELSDYHSVPTISWQDMYDQVLLGEIIGRTDYSQFEKKANANFDHYIDFWHRNNIETVYDKEEKDALLPVDINDKTGDVSRLVIENDNDYIRIATAEKRFLFEIDSVEKRHNMLRDWLSLGGIAKHLAKEGYQRIYLLRKGDYAELLYKECIEENVFDSIKVLDEIEFIEAEDSNWDGDKAVYIFCGTEDQDKNYNMYKDKIHYISLEKLIGQLLKNKDAKLFL